LEGISESDNFVASRTEDEHYTIEEDVETKLSSKTVSDNAPFTQKTANLK
jgi:hypothetical protein